VDDVTLTCVLGALEREINRRVKQKKKGKEQKNTNKNEKQLSAFAIRRVWEENKFILFFCLFV
jgi:hypothetical protein